MSPNTDLSDVTLEGAPGGARKEEASQVGVLKALELRLAAAVGPDRELDGRIWCALNDAVFRSYTPDSHGYPNNGTWHFFITGAAARKFFSSSGEVQNITGSLVPSYTSSIDAALTLVPEGWDARSSGPNFNSESGHGDQYFGYARECQPYRDVQEHRDAEGYAHHVSRAIALCLAAIRARISQSGQE